MLDTDLLREIDAFLAKAGMSARKLSLESTGDSGFVSRLRRGSNPTLATAKRVQKYMREHHESAKKKR